MCDGGELLYVTHVAGRTLATVDGYLELHRVRFAYPARSEAPVFKDLSLQVPRQRGPPCVWSTSAGLAQGSLHATSCFEDPRAVP